MTSDVRYASGEVPQVGDVVERVEYPIGYLSLGDQVTVLRIVNERSIDVGSDAVHYGIKQFKLIRRANHAQQPAPVETFVPVWGPEWEYVANHGTVFTFLLDDKSDVAPIKLACEFGDVWFSRDGAASFGASWAIVSQRPRTPAPVETPAPSQPADVPQSKYQWPKAVRQLLEDCAAEAVDVIGNKLPWSRDSLEARFAPHFKPVLAIIARHAVAAPEVAERCCKILGHEQGDGIHDEVIRPSELPKRLQSYIDGFRSRNQDLIDEQARQSADLTALRERLAVAEGERDEPKASFDLEDDGTPEYGTPAYELFDKAITWTVHQLKNVLGVKEWSTSGGGTDTLDGDLRMELNDLLKAAGRDDDSMEALRADLARAKEDGERMRVALVHLGSFFGCSAHLPWFSDDACDEVSAMIDEKGGEKRYDPAFYETYCAQVVTEIVTGAIDDSSGGGYIAELRRQKLEAHMRGDIRTADRLAALLGDPLPSEHEKADSALAALAEDRR